jgi:type I restriction enzyme R subunit
MALFNEETLVQQTTVEYLQQQLGWESVYNEDFGQNYLPRLMNGKVTP